MPASTRCGGSFLDVNKPSRPASRFCSLCGFRRGFRPANRGAAQERSIMLSRQLEGIAKAKAEGKYRGGIPTARAKAKHVFALVDAGKTRGEAAQALGISIRSVFRILRTENAPVAPPVARIRAQASA